MPSLPPPVVHALVRKSRLKRAPLQRPAAPLPVSLRSGSMGRRWSAPGTGRPQRRTLLVRAMRALHDLYALVRDRDTQPTAGPAASQADLVEARLMSDQWRNRAEAAEARAGELEVRLAAAEMAALELRSRIICLQGKLATTTATARYQSLALALEHGRPPLDSIAEPV